MQSFSHNNVSQLAVLYNSSYDSDTYDVYWSNNKSPNVALVQTHRLNVKEDFMPIENRESIFW